jgi:hypothetical protein
MTMTLTLYSDPAHAWLEVPIDELSRLGLSIYHDFSSYSYFGVDKRGAICAYLEEDCDLGIYLSRAIRRDGRRPLFKDKHNKRNSPVRKMERCPYGERFKANSQMASEFFRDRYKQPEPLQAAFMAGNHSPKNEWP